MRTVRVVGSHSWIRRRDPVSGLAHMMVFYGFLILLAGTTILAVQDDVVGPLGVAIAGAYSTFRIRRVCGRWH